MDNLKSILFLFFLIFYVPIVYGQEIDLGNQYYQQAEYDKARVIYEKLLKNEDNRLSIYTNYLSSLLFLKDYAAAEKFVIKTRKKNPQNIAYSADLILIYQAYSNNNLANKELIKLKEKTIKDEENLFFVCQYFIDKKVFDIPKDLYQSARLHSGNPFNYAFQMADLYKLTGNTTLMVNEFINLLRLQPNAEMLTTIENNLQVNLSTKEAYDYLEIKILKVLQEEPDNSHFIELITWLYIQQKDFYKAYIQAKAFDMRNKLQGAQMLPIGLISFKNKDYTNASLIFDYIKNTYPNGVNFHTAIYYSIKVKESLIQYTYPVDKSKIILLINDYQQYLANINQVSAQIEAKKAIALLYAFYLGDVDKSKKLLEDAIAITKDVTMLAKLKIDLADVKLLNNEIWDASLLYSQAEKLVKDSPLAYEAKFKNAKLFYYKGEFLLAQEQLNILKQATTREIANDAIQLSVFIQDQLLADSVSDILLAYSKIELLIFKNEYDIALNKLDSLLLLYPQDKITDDVYWLQSKVLLKIGNHANAVIKLQKIVDNYADDIYGDDAYFTLASLYQDTLLNVDKAKAMYEELLIKYPGSIFVPEARKRFRLLRGDKL